MILDEVENIIPTVNYFVDRVGNSKWKIEKDKIDFHDLTYIYKGRAKYIINSVEYSVSAGDLIYITSGSTREAYTYKDDPISSYACNFLPYKWE